MCSKLRCTVSYSCLCSCSAQTIYTQPSQGTQLLFFLFLNLFLMPLACSVSSLSSSSPLFRFFLWLASLISCSHKTWMKDEETGCHWTLERTCQTNTTVMFRKVSMCSEKPTDTPLYLSEVSPAVCIHYCLWNSNGPTTVTCYTHKTAHIICIYNNYPTHSRRVLP